MLFGLKQGQLVADMADDHRTGDMVTLEFMNQGRECWELSGMESGSQTLRDKTGKTPWSEILKGSMFPEQFPE